MIVNPSSETAAFNSTKIFLHLVPSAIYPIGNRITEHNYTNNAFTQWENTTYYVRDASGNVMATYEREAFN